MEKVFYDLHIHSCLSPCGDDLMTPPNIANMAWLKGLQLIAVADHNSCRNARAVAEAAKELPLTVIPGIELTTAEEIHVVCLFLDLMREKRRGPMRNPCCLRCQTGRRFSAGRRSGTKRKIYWEQ